VLRDKSLRNRFLVGAQEGRPHHTTSVFVWILCRLHAEVLVNPPIYPKPMESLDPECTPLKKTYDSCFNRWFERYLSVADHAQYVTPSSPPPQSSSSTNTAASQPGGSGADAARQKAMMKSREEYERDCGAAWAKYKDCVGVRFESWRFELLVQQGADARPVESD